MKILDWIRIAKISDPFETSIYSRSRLINLSLINQFAIGWTFFIQIQWKIRR